VVSPCSSWDQRLGASFGLARHRPKQVKSVAKIDRTFGSLAPPGWLAGITTPPAASPY
jgi:hypothetical protein